MSEVIEKMWNEATHEVNRENALRMLALGILSLEQITECSELTL